MSFVKNPTKICYLDTSALLALVFEQGPYQKLKRFFNGCDKTLSSPLIEAELLAAVIREGTPWPVAVRYLDFVDLIFPPRSLRRELERVFVPGYLKGADAHHLATALFLAQDFEGLTFCSLDKRQNQIAKALGFQTFDL